MTRATAPLERALSSARVHKEQTETDDAREDEASVPPTVRVAIKIEPAIETQDETEGWAPVQARAAIKKEEAETGEEA